MADEQLCLGLFYQAIQYTGIPSSYFLQLLWTQRFAFFFLYFALLYPTLEFVVYIIYHFFPHHWINRSNIHLKKKKHLPIRSFTIFLNAG